MKRYRIEQSTLQGEMTLPPSKSQTLRALLFSALGKGGSVIENPLLSPDTTAMIEACRQWGAHVDTSLPHQMKIMGTGSVLSPHARRINAGNSGIVLRFCTAVSALSPYQCEVTGDLTLQRQRPMTPLLEGLKQLGANAYAIRQAGYAPVLVKGPLHAGHALVSGEDSQPVSALLIAASLVDGETTLEVKYPGEKPWVALTLNWLNQLGAFCRHEAFSRYLVRGPTYYEGFEYTVPGDLSSLAFPVAAALITHSEITLCGVQMDDPQGDSALIFLFQRMGACIAVDAQAHTLHVYRSGVLRGISADLNECVDAVPIMAVVACYAEGETEIKNVAIVRHKECNRLRALVTELRKMGGRIEETADGLLIQGTPLKGACVHSYGDHRMAMALAIAGMGASGETVVMPTDCIAKTFPHFNAAFQKLGASLVEEWH